ncbi:MAG: hypothetical protein WC006_04395 [Bacilli bacterium]|nr:hypothetical protein [Bacilli bacterium]
MDLMKKHQIKKKLFALAGILIPLYTLTFSYKGPYGDLILVTFSQIGARYGAIEQLILWGIMTSLYYFSFLSYLFAMSGKSSITLKALLSITCITLLVTVFLPYAPSMFKITSKFHNFLAYITAASVVALLLIFIIQLKPIDSKLFYKSLATYTLCLLIVLYFLLTYGVSSLFQIVLSAIMCILMFVLLLYIENSKKIDIYKNLYKDSHEDTINMDIF